MDKGIRLRLDNVGSEDVRIPARSWMTHVVYVRRDILPSGPRWSSQPPHTSAQIIHRSAFQVESRICVNDKSRVNYQKAIKIECQ